MDFNILGIRHHGVGSAKNVIARLKELKPDHIIIEGPAELMSSFNLVDIETIKPPVSILLYNPNELSNASFYPFAEYSPEWQAVKYAQKHKISYETADMPKNVSFGIAKKELGEEKKRLFEEENQEEHPEVDADEILNAPKIKEENSLSDKKLIAPEGYELHHHPIELIAKIENYKNTDLWWEHHFEQKYTVSPEEHFEAIMILMNALREKYVNHDFEKNELREAFMRDAVRKAKKAGKENIVFICGAWHAPAIALYDDKLKKKTDKEILKRLPKEKVASTWIPWLNTRLSWKSGYGAGIESPGWYHHLWKFPRDNGEKWLIHVAKVFRKKNIDVSTAHIIEASRLANTLAAIRNMSRPGLAELDEAVITTICMGEDILMKYIREELTVGKKIGIIPEGLPQLPLQKDFEKKIKKYRFQIREDSKEYILDLRKSIGLEKSTFLHQLKLLGIKWGETRSKRTKGTFKEAWILNWNPEIILKIIDKGIWGNTVLLAAKNYVNETAKKTNDVSLVTELIKDSIVAQLFESVAFLINRIQELVSLSSDVVAIIGAVIPLIEISRYSDVRKTDEKVLTTLIEGLLVKIFISIETACYGIDDEFANTLFNLITDLNDKIPLLDNSELECEWINCLSKMSDQNNVASLIQGAVYRIMLDNKTFDQEKVQIGFEKALSIGAEPLKSAYWIEGFLRGSAMILILDNTIWNILYAWLQNLNVDDFDDLLPILRRTFSNYSTFERKQLGQKALKGLGGKEEIQSFELGKSFNHERAELALQNTAKLLGL